jgi:hypothetical protein
MNETTFSAPGEGPNMALISPKKRNMAINVNTAACGSGLV